MFDFDNKDKLVEIGKYAATIKLNETDTEEILSNCKKYDRLTKKI
jgi:hypothetical protein